MDITLDELKIITSNSGFDIRLLEKDYLLTYLLYLIKDVKGIYFKGGTALNKIFLNHKRLSEDLDFTLTRNLQDVEREIKNKLKGTIFKKITHDKRVENFIRLVVYYRLFHETGTIFIDLNAKAKILLQPHKTQILHFYLGFIPRFEISCLHKNEIIAEKVLALCHRYKPRDYFDAYNIIQLKLPISMSLIKKKSKLDNKRFNVKSIFKKTNKVYRTWDEDLSYITKTKPSFKEVMAVLKKYFKYKHK